MEELSGDNHTVVVDATFGPVIAYAGDLITKQLVEFGAHTRNQLAMLLSFIDEGDLVYDIGAHIGTFTIPIAKTVGAAGHVVAVELEPRNFDLLRRNLENHGLLGRVEIINQPIGDRPVRYAIRRTPGNTADSYLAEHDDGDILPVTLDSLHFVERRGAHQKDKVVVKLIVQGMELLALRSASRLISTKPILYIQLVESVLARFGTQLSEIEELLRAYGYRFFRNAGERNSCNDSFELVELRRLVDGGGFFEILAICPDHPKFRRAHR